MSFSTFSVANAGRTGASRPSTVFGAEKPFASTATAATSSPASSPFGAMSWRTAPSTARAHSAATSPFAASSAVGSLDATATPFGARSHPLAAPAARSSTSVFAFRNSAAMTDPVTAVPVSTGWYPLGDALAAPLARSQPSVFGVVRRREAANPFDRASVTALPMSSSIFDAKRSVLVSNTASSSFLSPFAPRAATATASNNPFAQTRSNFQSAEPPISFTTGAWQTRAPLAGANCTTTAVTASSETRRPVATNSSLAPSSSSTGFRFTFAPSWQPAPVATAATAAPQTAPRSFANCFSIPKPSFSSVNGLADSRATPSSALFPLMHSANSWAASDIDTSTSASQPATTPVAGFDVTLPKVGVTSESQPQQLLVARLDDNPYDVGRLERAVNAALGFQRVCRETANFLSATPKPRPMPFHANLGLPTQPLHCAVLIPARCTTSNRRMWRAAPTRRPRQFTRVARIAPSVQRAFRFRSSLVGAAGANTESVDNNELARDPTEPPVEVSCTEPLNSVVEQPLCALNESSEDDVTHAGADVDASTHADADDEAEAGSDESACERETNSACPILTTPHVSTVPELAQLQRMSSEDLAHVDGFAVCSEEFGEIEWPGLTDVRHLNLDAILLFSESEVVVYPEECTSKPPVGSGLNKRAILHLSGIFASDENCRAAAVEGEDATAAFVERLKRRTASMHAEFVGYEPVGGIWSFQVEHF